MNTKIRVTLAVLLAAFALVGLTACEDVECETVTYVPNGRGGITPVYECEEV
jgi:hypothetical protein